MRFLPVGNFDQWTSVIRLLMAVLGGYLIAHGATPASINNFTDALVNAIPALFALVTALLPIISFVWSMIRHTNKANVLVASEIPGVEKVLVKPTAAPELVTIAKDTSIPKVELVKP